MPGAAAATTVPSSKLKRPGAKKEELDDEEPLSKPAKKKPVRKKVKKEEESSEDDQPISAPKSVARKRKVKAESDADVSSDDDGKPIVTKTAPKKPAPKKVKKEEPLESPAPKANGKVKANDEGEDEGKGKGKKKKKKEEEQEEVYRWWEADAGADGTVKWQTLEHNGVIFPPPYELLPSNVKMKYDGMFGDSDYPFFINELTVFVTGKEVSLPPESEEVAGFYAALIESDHAKDTTFNKNFFNDWKGVLKKHPPVSEYPG